VHVYYEYVYFMFASCTLSRVNEVLHPIHIPFTRGSIHEANMKQA